MRIPDLDIHNLKTIPKSTHNVSKEFVNILDQIKDMELDKNIEGYR